MDFWTLDNLRALTGGSFVARPEGAAGATVGVSIDSRSIAPGQAFLALKGERTDGHAYADKAVAGGAALVICDCPADLPGGLSGPGAKVPVLKVAESGQALLRIASAYRKTLESTRVIAVAGSNGKTTTKGLIHSVLSTRLTGSASPKSFNNAVGVPLSILAAKKSDQYLVCEVGTNAPGEIAALAAVVSPDIAVITSIGREHLELLGSLEGVVHEEASLIASLRPGGAAIYNADAPLLDGAVRSMLASVPGASAVRYGEGDGADLRLTGVRAGAEGVSFALNARGAYELPLLGRHNALNAAAAVAVGRRLGLSDEDISRGLRGASGPEMRLQRQSAGGILFINDAYNANPDSMLAAIGVFAELAHAGRKVAVLGDMLEQGAGGPDVHREIGEALGRTRGIDAAVLVGPLMGFAAERLARAWGAERVSVFASASPAGPIAALLRAGDAVLLKGSRGMALERVIGAVGAGAIGEPKAAPRQTV